MSQKQKWSEWNVAWAKLIAGMEDFHAEMRMDAVRMLSESSHSKSVLWGLGGRLLQLYHLPYEKQKDHPPQMW